MAELLPAAETFSAFARRLQVRPSYVTKLRHDDRLVLTADGQGVRVAESLARIAATADPNRDDVARRHARARRAPETNPPDAPAAAAEKPEKPTAPAREPRAATGFSHYRARKMKADAELAEMDRDTRAGKLVETAAVSAAGAELGATVRALLENLPDQLAPLLVGDEDERRRLLGDHIEQILHELADKLGQQLQTLAVPTP